MNEVYVMLNGSYVTKSQLIAHYEYMQCNEYGSFEEWLVAGLQNGYVREYKEVDKI